MTMLHHVQIPNHSKLFCITINLVIGKEHTNFTILKYFYFLAYFHFFHFHERGSTGCKLKK